MQRLARIPIRIVAAALCTATVPLNAQNAQCAALPTTDNSRQTCDAAIDLTRAYHPIAGLLVSGGNPVLGSGGALGGLGRFAITFRLNAAHVVIPALAVDAANTVAQDDRVLAPSPSVEAAVGLLRGLPGGLFAIDLLGAVQLVPNEKAVSDIRVDPGAPRIGPFSLGLGFGARIGLLDERGPVPAISVSVMRRGVPQVGFGDLAAGDEIAADVGLRATNLRVVAAKRISALSVSAGTGWSRYTGRARAAYRSGGTGVTQAIQVDLSQSRTVVFLDAGLDLKLVRIVGEIGHQSGRDQQLVTNFQGFDDTRGTTFYSAGLRIGF